MPTQSLRGHLGSLCRPEGFRPKGFQVKKFTWRLSIDSFDNRFFCEHEKPFGSNALVLSGQAQGIAIRLSAQRRARKLPELALMDDARGLVGGGGLGFMCVHDGSLL